MVNCPKAFLLSRSLVSTFTLLAFLSVAQLEAQTGDNRNSTRQITVSDVVGMTRLEDRSLLAGNLFGNSPVAHFSPNGARFVVVLRKGNLDRKTNDFSILLYYTADARRSPKPSVLLT